MDVETEGEVDVDDNTQFGARETGQMITKLRSVTQGCDRFYMRVFVFEPTQHECILNPSGLYPQITTCSQDHYLVTGDFVQNSGGDEDRVYIAATQETAHVRIGLCVLIHLGLSWAAPSTVSLHPSPHIQEDGGVLSCPEMCIPMLLLLSQARWWTGATPGKMLLFLLSLVLWGLANSILVITYRFLSHPHTALPSRVGQYILFQCRSSSSVWGDRSHSCSWAELVGI